MYEYNGKVVAVEDVEKITVKLEIGFSITIEQKFLLYGIESISNTARVQSCQRMAKDRLKSYILGKHVIVKSHRHDSNIYLADVYIETSKGIISINDWLVKEDLAKYRISKTI
jgi:endonuclease YncB( thermonuclease family)